MKILWIGDGGVATGFARVNHSIIDRLPKDWEIHHIAVNYNGDPYDTKPNHKMYPARLGGDYLGINRINPILKNVNPDVIFILNDPWVVFDYLTRIPLDQRVVAYCPVDAKYLNKVWTSNIKKINQLVTYTEFGKNEFTKNHDDFDDIKVIPHGTDLKIFKPIADKAAVRKHLGLPEDAFIVFNGNRNQPRKRVDLTIKAFAEFAKDKPDNVLLYLHMGTVDAGYDIDELCRRYGVMDRLIKTSNDISPASYVSDADLNLIYNSADVGINTSMGEGWGLVNVEQACCKVPQIVPNYSATAEIFSTDMALHINIEREEPHLNILTEGGVIDTSHAAQCLETLYKNSDLRLFLADNAHKNFTQDKFTWNNVAEEFRKVLEEVATQEPKAKLLAEKQNDSSQLPA
jgi:D-inositol-3-phosphate glycosyltransferase